MTPGEIKCGMCGLPIHPSESGVRHFGTFVAHSESRCIDLLRGRLEDQQASIGELTEQIARTERNRDMWKGQCERQAEAMGEMRKVLRSFAREAAEWVEMGDTRPVVESGNITVGKLRRAAALVEGA